MTKHLYVGNLSFDTTEETLRQIFGRDGRSVQEVSLVTGGGRSRGFAFVEMETEEQAAAAIQALDGAELDDRRIKVGEGHDRPEHRLRSPARTSGRSGGRRARQ